MTPFSTPQKAPAKAKAAPRTAERPKVAKHKSKPAPKKKVLSEHDDNAEDSVMEVDSDRGMEASTSKSQNPEKKKKTATETYTKVIRNYSFVASSSLNCVH